MARKNVCCGGVDRTPTQDNPHPLGDPTGHQPRQLRAMINGFGVTRLDTTWVVGSDVDAIIAAGWLQEIDP